MITLPGTTLSVAEVPEKGAFEALRPIFAVSGGGLSLSQVAKLSGLYATTIQNWVKRGWVENPVNKKYGPGQVARILIINLLRPTMQLDQIITLMTYINGRVDDRSDDSIPDEDLYSMVCGLLLTPDTGAAIRDGTVHELVQARLGQFVGKVPDARARLSKALEILLLNIRAARLMQQAKALYEDILSADPPTPAASEPV